MSLCRDSVTERIKSYNEFSAFEIRDEECTEALGVLEED